MTAPTGSAQTSTGVRGEVVRGEVLLMAYAKNLGWGLAGMGGGVDGIVGHRGQTALRH